MCLLMISGINLWSSDESLLSKIVSIAITILLTTTILLTIIILLIITYIIHPTDEIRQYGNT